jgi:hypothetical protein
MPQDLSPLTRALRKETCPKRVLDEVGQRISTHHPSPGRWRFALPLAAFGLVLAGCLSVWQWQARENARQQAKVVEQATLNRARTANQAQEGLVLMGNILLNAGVRSGEVLLHRAIPPLRNSLQVAKNKITQRPEL